MEDITYFSRLMKGTKRGFIIIRNFSLWTVTSKSFEVTTFIIIIANSVTLALSDPLTTEASVFEAVSDKIFLAFYTGEMALKIVALGFVTGPRSYIRDGWNFLDFIVVIAGYLSLSFSDYNLAGLRIFRVLRPLRSI